MADFILRLDYIAKLPTCSVKLCHVRRAIFVPSAFIYRGLENKEKTAFEGKECVKEIELHSSFISLAVKVSITFQTCD